MTSEIRVNKLTNRIGLSTVTFADSGIGVTVTGRIDPDTDSARDLGTTSVRWRNVYADTLYGDGSNLTGISGGTSLSGSTNNTVCTVTGANAIQGESTLTYDGNKLKFGGGTRTLDNGYYDDIVIDNSDISSGANGGSGISLISGSSSWCGLIFGDVDEHQQAYVKYSNQSEYMQIHAPSAGYISFDTGSERLRITSTGKIGIGVVPSAWDTTTTSKVLQVGNSCIFDYNNGDYFHVGHNFYWDGSNYKYITNDSASRLLQNDGAFTFFQAASGTANNNITWNQRLKITSSGDYGFNDTSPTAHASGNNTVLSIKGKGSSYSGKIDFKDSSGNIDSYINSDNSILQFYCDPNSQNGNTAMTFSVHGSERARITSDGKVVAGGNGTGYPCRLQSHGAGDLLDLNSTSGAGKIRFYESGAGRFNIETLNGAAGIRFLDALNNVEAMRIHANGRITTPNQPMYSGMGYVGQGTQVQTSIYAIRPSAVYANLGSHFDTSTGVFTCPIAGRYLCIGAMGRRTTAFNWNGFYLIHNGATKGDMWFPPARDNGTNPASPAAFRADQFTYNPTNLSAVLTCAANDTISFAFHSSYAAPLNSSANYAQFILIG